MRVRKIIIFLFIAFLVLPTTLKEARKIAYNWLKLRAVTSVIPEAVRITSIEELKYKGRKIGYLARYSRGFIIIPDNQLLPPIKFASQHHPFDRNNPIVAYVLEELAEIEGKLKEKPELSSVFLSSVRPLWRVFTEGSLFQLALLVKEMKGPLVKSRWGQGWPYNYYTPTIGVKKTYVGCVAVAFAQIMWYWRWPDRGVGSKSYFWVTGNKWLSTSFDHPYNWANMPEQLTYSSPSDKVKEVARLLYDVGVAVEMDYGVDGSAAYPAQAVVSFPKHLKYSSEIKEIYRVSYDSGDHWFERMRLEVGVLRPLEFTICGDQGCHAVVVDGYRVVGSMKQVHLNFGWDGWYDGYYTVDNIRAGGYDFSTVSSQAAVVNILPPHIVSPPADISLEKKIDRGVFIISRIDRIKLGKSPTNPSLIKSYRIYRKDLDTAAVELVWEGKYTPVIDVRSTKSSGKFAYAVAVVDSSGKESIRTPFTSLYAKE